MFPVTHYGLYFTPAMRDALLAAASEEHIVAAWDALHAKAAGEETPRIDAALACGLLSRLAGDAAAYETGVSLFSTVLHSPVPETSIDAVGELLARLHTFELLRDQGNLQERSQRAADGLCQQVEQLVGGDAYLSYVEQLWVDALKLIAGLVFEREQWLNEGVAAFKRVIDGELRPQGFIQPAVEPDRRSPYLAIERQILATKALVLMAEAAAASLDQDLWNYEARGVSVATTAIYPIYYFYTTHKWKWDEDLSPETVQAAFRKHGGWLEITQRRLQHKDIALLLGELRPVWDYSGGGMTTLTHGWTVKPKRRGLFG